MKKALESITNAARRVSLDKVCGVNGCQNPAESVRWLKPLDPIDNDETPISLCESHQQWADERNAFAEMIIEELREKRAEIGKEHMDKVQRLAHPQEGDVSEDFLMGDISETPDHMEGLIQEE